MDDLRQRFLDAAALRALGRASPADDALLAQALQAHPDWAADLDEQQRTVAAVRDALQARDARPMLDFDTVMRGLPAAKPPVPVPVPVSAPRAPAAPGWLARLQAWWQRPAGMGLAFATIAALALGLAVQTQRLQRAPGLNVVATMDGGTPATGQALGPVYRSASASAAGAGAGGRAPLTLRFEPALPVGQAVQLLQAQQLTVVDGPNADGVFLVDAPLDGLDERVAALRRMPQVLSVQRLAGGQ